MIVVYSINQINSEAAWNKHWEMQLRIAPMKGVIMLGLKDINVNNQWKTFDGESQTYF